MLSALSARLDRHSEAAAQTRLIRRERQLGWQQIFDEIRALFEEGNSIGEIARKLGLGRRRVERWVGRIDVLDRNAMASTPFSPAYFGVLLSGGGPRALPKSATCSRRNTSRLYRVLQ